MKVTQTQAQTCALIIGAELRTAKNVYEHARACSRETTEQSRYIRDLEVIIKCVQREADKRSRQQAENLVRRKARKRAERQGAFDFEAEANEMRYEDATHGRLAVEKKEV